LGPHQEVSKVVRLLRGKLQSLFGGELQQLANGGRVDPLPIERANLQGAPTSTQQTIQCVHARDYPASLNAGDRGLRDPCPRSQVALAEPCGTPSMTEGLAGFHSSMITNLLSTNRTTGPVDPGRADGLL